MIADRRLIAVWAGLVAASFIAFETLAVPFATAAGVALILLVAALKVLAIGWEFMELRHAPRGLGLAFAGWVVAVSIALWAMLVI